MESAGSDGPLVEMPTSIKEEKISVSIGRIEMIPLRSRRLSTSPKSGGETNSPIKAFAYCEIAAATSVNASS